MAVRMVVDVEGVEYQVTLSRDDAANYVADASLAPRHGEGSATPLPMVRVVDQAKERAMSSLLVSLAKLGAERRAGAPARPDAG
jgi:hypothetical protein